MNEFVKKVQEYFKDYTGTTKMYTKGTNISPIFSVWSCAKNDRMIRKIESLEIGESTYNSGGTLITRVF